MKTTVTGIVLALGLLVPGAAAFAQETTPQPVPAQPAAPATVTTATTQPAPPAGSAAAAQPAAPAQPAPPPPETQPLMPPPAQAPVITQPTANGQWVYSDAYGWIWVPTETSSYEVAGQPYVYIYTPSYGWTWYVSPWGWGHFYVGPWVHRAWGYPHVWYGGHWVARPHYYYGGHYGGGHVGHAAAPHVHYAHPSVHHR